jgi:hypothetical protein
MYSPAISLQIVTQYRERSRTATSHFVNLHRLLRHLIPPDPIPHYRTRLLGLILTKARGADMSIKTGCTTANVLIRGDLDRSGHGRTDFSIFHGQKPGNGASSRSCAVSLAHSMISLGKTLKRAS